MENFFDNIISSIGLNDALDIIIVAFIFYKILEFIKETRAQQLIKGLLILVAAFFLSDLFNLYALNWLLRGTMTVGAIALVVVFQPELRRALEYVGRSNSADGNTAARFLRISGHGYRQHQRCI